MADALNTHISLSEHGNNIPEPENYDDVSFRTYDTDKPHVPIFVSIVDPYHHYGIPKIAYVISASSDVLEYALLREYYTGLIYSLFYTLDEVTNESLHDFFKAEYEYRNFDRYPDWTPFTIKYFMDGKWADYNVNVEKLNKMFKYEVNKRKARTAQTS